MTEIKKYKMLINGNWTSGSENQFFESLNPYTGKMRRFCLDGKPPLNIQKVESITATSIYCSKWMNRNDDGEGFFFTTPSNNKPCKVAA